MKIEKIPTLPLQRNSCTHPPRPHFSGEQLDAGKYTEMRRHISASSLDLLRYHLSNEVSEGAKLVAACPSWFLDIVMIPAANMCDLWHHSQ